MTIHKEGYASLLLSILVLGGLNIGLLYLVPEQGTLRVVIGGFSVLIFLIVLQFFRNPSRSTSSEDHQVIAPADGKVVVIEEVYEGEYLKAKCMQVSIFMSPINVHVNRSPIQGKVEYFKYHPGKYLVAWHPKSSEENERTTLVLRTESGAQLLMRQIAGALARRIVCYAKPGDSYAPGQEFGFIKFGSRVDVYLPLGTAINVTLGQLTRGGDTVIATLA